MSPEAIGDSSQNSNTQSKLDVIAKNQLDMERLKELNNMYRVVSRNHVAYIAIGDRRANYLVGTCTLVISVTFTVFLRELEEVNFFFIPGVVLILTCVVAMVLGVLSIRPHIPGEFYTGKQSKDGDRNMLYFINFYKMTLKEYGENIDEILKDEHTLKRALIRDVYDLGLAGAHKYRLLRISYDVLMYGVVLSTLIFLGIWFWK